MWRGRLPHWRADNESYYVTFKHKRPLEESERSTLMSHLEKAQRRKLDYAILCVLPEVTEMIFRVQEAPSGEPYELSDVVEKAKQKAGRQIMKKTGEKWPPFWFESYDRILRDEAEYEEFFLRILESPVGEGLCEDSAEYLFLFVADAD